MSTYLSGEAETQKHIQYLIASHSALDDIIIMYNNAKIPTDSSAEFVRIFFNHGSERTNEIGNRFNVSRASGGFIQIDILVPEDSGTLRTAVIADIFTDLFHGYQQNHLSIRPKSFSGIPQAVQFEGSNAGYFVKTVSFPIERDTARNKN